STATIFCEPSGMCCRASRSCTPFTSSCRSAIGRDRWSEPLTNRRALRGRPHVATNASPKSCRKSSSCANGSFSHIFYQVTLFVAPSKFLRERYVDWGIPADRILFEEYGRTPPPGDVLDNDGREQRNRFGFFGQLTPFKGAHVVLEAMRDVAVGNDSARPASD